MQSLEQHRRQIDGCFVSDLNALVYEWKHSKTLDEGSANNQKLEEWVALCGVDSNSNIVDQ